MNKKGEVATLLTLGLVLVGGIVTFGLSLLSNNQKNLASNTKAATCAKGVSIGSGYYSCGANCGLTSSGKCLNYTHNSTDPNCSPCGANAPVIPVAGDDEGLISCEFKSKLECQNDDTACPSNNCVTTGCKVPTAKCIGASSAGPAAGTLGGDCKTSTPKCTGTLVCDQTTNKCKEPASIPAATGKGPCCIAYRPDMYGCQSGQSKVVVYSDDPEKAQINCLSYGSSTMKYFFCNDYGASPGCSSNTPWGNAAPAAPAGSSADQTGQGGQTSGDPYPQNSGRTPGMACCFLKNGVVTEYASSDARELNDMGPCTTAYYTKPESGLISYGATSWFECADGSSGMSKDQYEAANAPVAEPVIDQVVRTGKIGEPCLRSTTSPGHANAYYCLDLNAKCDPLTKDGICKVNDGVVNSQSQCSDKIPCNNDPNKFFYLKTVNEITSYYSGSGCTGLITTEKDLKKLDTYCGVQAGGGGITVIKTKYNCPAGSKNQFYYLGNDNKYYSDANDTTGENDPNSICGSTLNTSGQCNNILCAGSNNGLYYSKKCWNPVFVAGKASCGGTWSYFIGQGCREGYQVGSEGEAKASCTQVPRQVNVKVAFNANNLDIEPSKPYIIFQIYSDYLGAFREYVNEQYDVSQNGNFKGSYTYNINVSPTELKYTVTYNPAGISWKKTVTGRVAVQNGQANIIVNF